jgi:hypothetical protein
MEAYTPWNQPMLHGRHDRKIKGAAESATLSILCDCRAFSKIIGTSNLA